MKENQQLPPVMSKRNNFTALEEHVDRALHELARRGVFGKDPTEQAHIRIALQHTLSCFLSDIKIAFTVACGAAMSQAEDLIQHPGFYENRKARHKKAIARNSEERAKQLSEKRERELFGPSPEEIERKRRYALQMIEWHEHEIARCRKELADLPNMVGPKVSAPMQ
jgi:hypothetical protein